MTCANAPPAPAESADLFGQPVVDPPMPAGVELGWSLQDILAYSQTLPEK